MGNSRQRNTAQNHTRKEFRQLKSHRQQKTQVIDEDGVPYVTSKPSKSTPFTPTESQVAGALITVRLFFSFISTIGDCDETYNYWEPLHYLIYGKGFQTWEYAPQYGLRSYAYLLLHSVIPWFCAHGFQLNPMYIYYINRAILAIICGFVETYFYIGVSKEIGANVGRITLGILIFSSAMFVSSSALLPSSTSMYLVMLSHGAWFQQSYALAIFTTALSTFISWPFAALLGFPIAVDILLRKGKYWFFIKWSLISTLTILVPQIGIDSFYYGKLVVAPFNIVKYNIFTR